MNVAKLQDVRSIYSNKLYLPTNNWKIKLLMKVSQHPKNENETGIRLTKHVQDPGTENDKVLPRGFKEHSSKQRTLPC